MNDLSREATGQTQSGRKVALIPGVDFVRIRFAGDSGDGIQLTGTRFAEISALYGNDFATFPDYPAEIRAPAGTTYGVSAYSIKIGNADVMTHGDQPDMLVALNPAALKVHLGDLRPDGILILDTGSFDQRALERAGYKSDPRADGTLDKYRVIAIDISGNTLKSLSDLDLSKSAALRSKNMWTLGLILKLFDREMQPLIDWLKAKFKSKPEIAEANARAVKAGYMFADTAEMPGIEARFAIPPAQMDDGAYRTVTGAETLSWGLFAGSRLAGLRLFLGSYPITPSSPLLHALAKFKAHGVTTFQAEDEIAAVCSAIGASYAGALGATTSSGPGIALKTEALGLAVVTELPLIVIDVQRGGPSTGLPTKTEQADLLQAVFGRNGDTPIPVLAAASPSDCFDIAIEAIRIAVTHMTPVFILSDGYIANAAEPWKLPDLSDPAYAPFPARFRTEATNFSPMDRDPDTLGRTWALPGTPELMHRIGGLEKDKMTGHVSYDPVNHEAMTRLRQDKMARIQDRLPEQTVNCGPDKGPLAVLSWGSTKGSVELAVRRLAAEGVHVGHVHLRHLWPLPKNLKTLLERYDRILLPEINSGQLRFLLKGALGIETIGYNKVAGQPLKVGEMQRLIKETLGVAQGEDISA